MHILHIHTHTHTKYSRGRTSITHVLSQWGWDKENLGTKEAAGLGHTHTMCTKAEPIASQTASSRGMTKPFQDFSSLVMQLQGKGHKMQVESWGS